LKFVVALYKKGLFVDMKDEI